MKEQDYYNSELRKEGYKSGCFAMFFSLAILICLLLGYGIISIF